MSNARKQNTTPNAEQLEAIREKKVAAARRTAARSAAARRLKAQRDADE